MTITITDFSEVVERIRCSTEEERNKFRQTGIGASEAAVVLDISPWGSRFRLHFEKRGEIDGQFENKQMKMGKKLEALVIETYQDETGNVVYPNQDIFRLKLQPHIFATPDALTDFNGGVEAKTAVYAGAKKWDEGVPDYYEAQAQAQMLVMGWDWVDFPVLKNGIDFEIFRVERNESVIRSIAVALDMFWEDVQAGIPPQADGHEATSKALTALYGVSDPDSVIDVDYEVLETLQKLERVKESEKAVKEDRAFYENQLKAILGTKEIALVDGRKAFSWKAAETTRLDSDKFRKAFPRASKRFEKTTSVRTFRTHNMEGK